MAEIDTDFYIRIPVAGTLYLRYQLERFAEWCEQDGQATYRITEESVWQSQNAGIRGEQIIGFLRRVSGDRVPGVLMRSLLAWGGRSGRATIARVVMLRTADERTMNQIAASTELKPLLGERLSPTTCLVEEQHLAILTERLKVLGIWPRLLLD